MKTTRRLRQFLLVGLVGSNALVIGISAFSLYQSRQQYEHLAEVTTRNVALALEQNLTKSVEKVDLVLRSVADELERQLATGGIDEVGTPQFLDKQQKRLPELESIRVANASGRVILGKGVEMTPNASWADRGFFIYHRDHDEGRMIVSKPLVGKVFKQFLVSFALRYNYPDGRFAGVISAPISVDYFASLLSRFNLGKR